MPLSDLEDLPDEALLCVVSFLRHVPDLLSCERTCKKLHSVIADDTVWKFGAAKRKLKKGDPCNANTNRKKFCLAYNYKRISKFRCSDSNLLTEVFDESPCQEWTTIVESVMQQYLPDHLMVHNEYTLRGDTMFTLMELLQSYLTETFVRAYLITTEASHDLTLTLSHLKLQEKLGQAHGASATKPCLFALFKDPSPAEIEFENSLIDLELRDKIIRGAAFRASVVKVDNEVYAPVWASAVKLIAQIFEQVCEELLYLSPPTVRAGMKRKLPTYHCFMSMRRIPPHATVLSPCSACGAPEYLHVPVPRQIEEAARKLLPTFAVKIYGGHWMCDGESEDEQNEIEEAEALYEIVPEIDWDSDSGSGTDEEEMGSDEEDTDKIGSAGVPIDPDNRMRPIDPDSGLGQWINKEGNSD